VNVADKTLTCRDCGSSFVWTTGEQEFYASRGLTNPPGRCPDCRAQRKARQDSGGYSGGYSSGGYGRSERGPREMHTTTCASCGGEARVPFIPRGDRPVYCSNCFEKERPSSVGSRY
jgi:CxxC-x17-CxxC domain-containing protein